jgi:CSLREA domain-containing protein
MAVWLLSLPAPAGAVGSAPTSFAIVNVTTTADEYDVVPNSDCSLREAIQSQNDNANFGGCVRGIVPGAGGIDTILLPSGTYTLTRTGAEDDLNLTGDLDLRGSVIISATLANVVGGAAWDDRLVHVLSSTVTLKGLLFRGGAAGTASGGAMQIELGATVSVSDSKFDFNSASSGGSLINYGTLTLTRVHIFGNVATVAGGGVRNQGGVLTLINSMVSSNVVQGLGGGGGSGGGIYSVGGTLALTGVTLNQNSTKGSGGAISVNGGTATLTNTTVTENASDHIAGGLHNVHGTVKLTNVTFMENSAPDGGASIYSFGSGSLTLVNTIVADSLLSDNCGPDPLQFTGGFNLSSDGSCDFGAGHDNVDPLLGSLRNNGGPTLTHMPRPGSPAIDGGTNTGCPATGQRGEPRPQGAACEVGAVEVEAPPLLLFIPLVLR